jgi:two-component system response regulator HydG
LARIVVVEVDDADRARLRALLVDAGHEVTEACSFQEGRSVLAREAANLLVTNVRLGAFNGLQLLLLNPTPLPGVVIAHFPDPLLAAEAVRAGAEYLAGPHTPDELLERVELALNRPRP